MKVVKMNCPEDLFEIINSIFNEVNAETSKKEEGKENITLDIPFFINRIAERKGWKAEKVNGWLGSIEQESPVAAFSIMAREIAVYLDRKYPDHIENSKHIYSISTLDGRIHEIDKDYIKNYGNFAAFRTVEDAKVACSILRDKLKDMFKCRKRTKKSEMPQSAEKVD